MVGGKKKVAEGSIVTSDFYQKLSIKVNLKCRCEETPAAHRYSESGCFPQSLPCPNGQLRALSAGGLGFTLIPLGCCFSKLGSKNI